VASNPSPAGACDGYVPVSSQTFQGTVFNKGNDTAANNWTSSNGLTGSDTLETNLIFIPTGENLTDAGWGMSGNAVTQFNYVQTLVDSSTYDPSDPNFHKFQGRQIYETGTGTGSDGCYNAAASILGSAPAVLQFYIAGAIWNVGASGSSGYSGNTYLFDTVGYDLARVDYYRTNFPSILPCSTTLQQTMEIVNNVPGQPSADTSSGLNHTLTATIGPNYVSVSKDSHSEILYR
jgi:hypothetical protein